MASAKLAEAVEPRKKSNVKYASFCAILASTASIILGYGMVTKLNDQVLVERSFIFVLQEFVGDA